MTSMHGLTSITTVGCTQYPRSNPGPRGRPPPSVTLAPSSFARSTALRALSYCPAREGAKIDVCHRIAQAQRRRRGDVAGDELVEHRFVHKRALGANADLAAVAEASRRQRLDLYKNVRVTPNDGRLFAPGSSATRVKFAEASAITRLPV